MVDCAMKWFKSIGSNDGETVEVTPDAQGKEETSTIPSFVELENYTKQEIEVLERTFSNYKKPQDEIANELNCSIGLVGNTQLKFLKNNLEELFSGGLGYYYLIDGKVLKAKHPDYSRGRIESILDVELTNGAWGAMTAFADSCGRSDYNSEEANSKPQSGEEPSEEETTQKKKAYEYFKMHNDAELKQPKETLGLDKLSVNQLRSLKGNAIKHSNQDNVENGESNNSEMMDTGDEKVEQIDSAEGEMSQIKGELDSLQSVIDKLVDEVNGGGSKRYVGNNPTITLELTDFEAMFIADRLWEAGERFESMNEERLEAESKWWARKIHDERNTRED